VPEEGLEPSRPCGHGILSPPLGGIVRQAEAGNKPKEKGEPESRLPLLCTKLVLSGWVCFTLYFTVRRGKWDWGWDKPAEAFHPCFLVGGV